MMQTLVGAGQCKAGRANFAKGLALYFARHDGQAVTCDDFAQAVADANPDSDLAFLLPQFKRWYSQAGTPRLAANGQYDATARTYTLHFSQSCAPTPGQPEKEPFVIPVSLGLIGMQERASLLGGQLTVASQPGRGCKVHLQCPVQTTPQAGAHPL